MESIKYNACLPITGAIRGTNYACNSLQLYRWYNFVSFRKIFKNDHPNFFFNIICVRSTPYATRTVVNIPLIKIEHKFFKHSFFPSAIIK